MSSRDDVREAVDRRREPAPSEVTAGAGSQAEGECAFRKKPVVIQAERFDPATLPLPFSGRGDPVCYDGDRWYIETLEGEHIVSPGDWVIRGVKGEFYPCKPDIFAATYEPADAPPTNSPEPTAAPAGEAPIGYARADVVEAIRENPAIILRTPMQTIEDGEFRVPLYATAPETPRGEREDVLDVLGRDGFSPGLDALAGVARYGEVEDRRLDDLRRLYSQLVDLRTTLLRAPTREGDTP